jgi:pimeloyl-ACP methyl ester carboxylesterase
MVDASFVYYREETLVERLAEDVLVAARDRGYRSAWLVGFSLGGYGALLTARAHPDLVDGVVLVGPLLGLPNLTRPIVGEIRDAGGLSRWQGDRDARRERHHFRDPHLIWSYLKRASSDPEHAPIVLVHGTEDRYAWKHDVLAAALPAERVIRGPGGHDLETWRRLFRRALDSAPWKSRGRERARPNERDEHG